MTQCDWKMPLTVVLAMGMAVLAGCGKPTTAFTLAGSTAFQPFAEKLADQYMTKTPGVRITVQGGGSAVGIQSALSGAAQVGMADLVNLPPQAQELKSFLVAKDGIAIIVHPENKIADLTTDQIRDIFCGKIRNWSGVGGVDASINVVSREAGSGTRTSFEQIIKDLTLGRDALVQDSNGAIRETVANDVNAIGYLSHGLINAKVKALTVDGVACETAAIIKGDYKLVRPVFLLTRGEPPPDVRAFLDYILSDEGQGTIKSNGLLPAQ